MAKIKKTTFLKVYTKIGVASLNQFGGKWELYKWDDKAEAWFDLEGFGYYKAYLEGCGDNTLNSFVFGNTTAQIDKEIEMRMFIAKNGPKNKEGAIISCPNCGWDFNTPAPIGDPEYSSYADEAYRTQNCICGTSFSFQVRFEIVVQNLMIDGKDIELPAYGEPGRTTGY